MDAPSRSPLLEDLAALSVGGDPQATIDAVRGLDDERRRELEIEAARTHDEHLRRMILLALISTGSGDPYSEIRRLMGDENPDSIRRSILYLLRGFAAIEGPEGSGEAQLLHELLTQALADHS